MTGNANADMMSDMKTFTVRELDREPSRILDTCDKEGAVCIRRRGGRAYLLQPQREKAARLEAPDIMKRLRKIFPKPIPAAQVRHVDKLLAGE